MHAPDWDGFRDIDQKWIPQNEYATRSKQLAENISQLEDNRPSLSLSLSQSAEGWYDARYYYTNSPIAIVYRAEVYIKNSEVRKIKFNSSASSKLNNTSSIYIAKPNGCIANRKLGSWYGKNLTIYIGYKEHE